MGIGLSACLDMGFIIRTSVIYLLILDVSCSFIYFNSNLCTNC
jgi:hypothetical protein